MQVDGRRNTVPLPSMTSGRDEDGNVQIQGNGRWTSPCRNTLTGNVKMAEIRRRTGGSMASGRGTDATFTLAALKIASISSGYEASGRVTRNFCNETVEHRPL